MKKRIFCLLVALCLLPNVSYAQFGGEVRVRPNTTLSGDVLFVTTAGSAEVLADETPCKRVLIKALLENTGNIIVGGSDVSFTGTVGFQLDAGEVWIGTVDNLSDIYLDAEVSGEGAGFTYEN